MVKKFSKIMEMNTGQRVVRINAFVGIVVITMSFGDKKPLRVIKSAKCSPDILK